MGGIVETIIGWALGLVSRFGYGGIFFTMTLESMGVPIPSEIIVPFGGFLASRGEVEFWIVVAGVTLANLAGSLIFYTIGFWGGRPAVEKYGKYVLIHKDEIEKTDAWFRQHGAIVAFFSRLLPGVRTFSSIILGAGKLNLKKFFWFTLAGSFLWNLPLAYIGLKAGDNWNLLRPYFHRFENIVAALIILGVVFFVFKHVHRARRFNRHPDSN